MLREKNREDKLFYQFNLDSYFPEDHFLRQVQKHISFEFIRHKVKHLYSNTGKPAIDPVVLVKMMLIGYFYDIKSERQLEKDIQVNSFPGPLGQVIINVIMNAINHAFDHKAHGIISIECKKTGNDTAAVIISDNGKGIPDNEVKKVFDPFYTTKLGQGGSGLGMHIAYNIVNGLLGGDISVSSKTGEGTTVSLSLPLIAPDKS